MTSGSGHHLLTYKILNACCQRYAMSSDREKKYKDTKETAKGGIVERPEPPIDKPDPTEPVKVRGAKEGKGTDAGL